MRKIYMQGTFFSQIYNVYSMKWIHLRVENPLKTMDQHYHCEKEIDLYQPLLTSDFQYANQNENSARTDFNIPTLKTIIN